MIHTEAKLSLAPPTIQNMEATKTKKKLEKIVNFDKTKSMLNNANSETKTCQDTIIRN